MAVVSVPEHKSARNFHALQTFVGHRDWIFGLSWLNDRQFISASRDRTMKVWTVDDKESVCYSPVKTVELVNKVRDVRYNPGTEVLSSLGSEGSVRLWDASLLREKSSIPIAHTRELVCMALNDTLAAAGSQSHITLIDPRLGRAVQDVLSVDAHHGVRSLVFKGEHLLSSGSGRGRISFLDLRINRYLEIERDISASDADLVQQGHSGRCTLNYLQTGEGHIEDNAVYRVHFSVRLCAGR